MCSLSLPGRIARVAVSALALLASDTALAGTADPVAPVIAAPANSYAPYVTEAARRFNLSEAWIWAVMRTESRGNPRAVSAPGAIGLMQIMPATWTGLTARYALGNDPFEVRANILAGAAYLREMLDRYGDLRTALAAYNAGPGRADAWRAGRRPLPGVTLAYVSGITSAVGTSMPMRIDAPLPIAPPNWRTAALFVVRDTGAWIDPSAASTAQSDPTLPGAPEPVSAIPGVPVETLFIPLSTRIAR